MLLVAGCLESNPQPAPAGGSESCDTLAPYEPPPPGEVAIPEPPGEVDVPDLTPDIKAGPEDATVDGQAVGGPDALDVSPDENTPGDADAELPWPADGGDPVEAFGSACAHDDDCASAKCIGGYEGGICSIPCDEDEDCPDQYGCGSIVMAYGEDPSWYCTPLFDVLCAPCYDAQDCNKLHQKPQKGATFLSGFYNNPGHEALEFRCLDEPWSAHSFCTVSAPAGFGCPDGFQAIKDPEDGNREFCAPVVKGQCPNCPWPAENDNMEGWCDHEIEEILCPGTWMCMSFGWSECIPAPSDEIEEIGDGKDNDCDGLTDEDVYMCGGWGSCDAPAVCQPGFCGQHEAEWCGLCPLGMHCVGGQCKYQWECLEPGMPGCPCTGPEECNSGFCAGGPQGSFCTLPCDASCKYFSYSMSDWVDLSQCVQGCPKGLECQQFYSLLPGLDFYLCLAPLYCESDSHCAGKLTSSAECAAVKCIDFQCVEVEGACNEPCEPQCTGLTCGTDGCGGACGECGPDAVCTKGNCLSCPAECGESLTCGELCGLQCGECEAGFGCSDAGQCLCDCIADCVGKQCGPDGCFGSCGECAAGQSCQAGQCCTIQCEDKKCGPDGCGGICGFCGPWELCTDGQCGPCVPDCEGKECGPDGCGDSCGECPEPWYCTPFGKCQACWPDCEGKECGSDGCGWSCGQCPFGKGCDYYYGNYCTSGGGCAPGCFGSECGPDGCGGQCGLCPNNFECQYDAGDDWWGHRCVPTPSGPCLEADDCYAYIAEEDWPYDYKPVCQAETCTCAAEWFECIPDCVTDPCGDDGCGKSCTSPPVSLYWCKNYGPEDCEALGGIPWEEEPPHLCGCPTGDDGCPCSHSGECQGLCVTDFNFGGSLPACDQAAELGFCTPYAPFQGCYCEVLQGEVLPTCTAAP